MCVCTSGKYGIALVAAFIVLNISESHILISLVIFIFYSLSECCTLGEEPADCRVILLNRSARH